MTDRGTLFLFSLGVILAALGVAAWLIGTGQAAYIDGLFLLLCCLVLMLAFGLYVRYLIRSVMQAAAPPIVPAKIAAATHEKRAPLERAATKPTAEKRPENAEVVERR